MIEPEYFYNQLINNNTDFFAGVPDSLLRSFCAYITDYAGENAHFISANEGSAVGLAAGYHLATGKIPLVYMQNSGIGNATNPLLSLVDPDVYRIPLVLVIGWRGEPGVHDEPQHKKQGKVTLALLETMGIPYSIMATNENELHPQISDCYRYIAKNSSPYAFVVRKDTFAPYAMKKDEEVKAEMTREEAIEEVMLAADKRTIIVSTTGMASRELYELREKHGMSHERDFLTVGSMGHASQIALSIALYKRDRNVICIDGDGACIMQMGGLMTIGTRKPANLRHIIINNGAHDSVGGQPTVALEIDIPGIARAAGYGRVISVTTKNGLKEALSVKDAVTTLIEIRTQKGSRNDLGRPKESPWENKAVFMDFINANVQ
jgi:phosphonopyruvate decarboxylase